MNRPVIYFALFCIDCGNYFGDVFRSYSKTHGIKAMKKVEEYEFKGL